MRGGKVLASNVSTVADQPAVDWVGGRTAIVIHATTYPTTVTLQLLGMDGSTQIGINATTYSTNQVTAYDLPAGQYRLHLSGGTSAALYAALVAIPYTM